MCIFWVIHLTGIQYVLRKETELCQQGLRGNLCLDKTKISGSYSHSLWSTTNGILTTTPTSSTLTLENVMITRNVTVEYSILQPYKDKLDSLNARQINDLYISAAARTVSSPVSPEIDEISTSMSKTTVSSMRKIQYAPSIIPEDSISNVSENRVSRVEPQNKSDKKTTISKWAEESSVVTMKTSKPKSTVSSTVSTNAKSKSSPSIVSRGSSRRSVSYSAHRQLQSVIE